VHDLVLSAEPARKQVFAEIDRWMAAFIHHDVQQGVQQGVHQGKENSP
jgi:hypothetical protein